MSAQNYVSRCPVDEGVTIEQVSINNPLSTDFFYLNAANSALVPSMIRHIVVLLLMTRGDYGSSKYAQNGAISSYVSRNLVGHVTQLISIIRMHLLLAVRGSYRAF